MAGEESDECVRGSLVVLRGRFKQHSSSREDNSSSQGLRRLADGEIPDDTCPGTTSTKERDPWSRHGMSATGAHGSLDTVLQTVSNSGALSQTSSSDMFDECILDET